MRAPPEGYRVGVPSVAHVQAHAARGGVWQVLDLEFEDLPWLRRLEVRGGCVHIDTAPLPSERFAMRPVDLHGTPLPWPGEEPDFWAHLRADVEDAERGVCGEGTFAGAMQRLRGGRLPVSLVAQIVERRRQLAGLAAHVTGVSP